MKKLLFIITLFIASCGYKQIYLNNNLENIEFYEIIIDGENQINNQIINSLNLKEDNFNEELAELFLTSAYAIDEISKNSKGQTQTYRSSISVIVKIIKNDEIIKKRTFTEEFTYNKKENKFELTEYQANVKNELTNRTIEDLILFLNLE